MGMRRNGIARSEDPGLADAERKGDSTGNVLEISGLDLELGGRTILANVNMVLEKGSFTCIVGRSGSGKTSLLRVVGGLLEPTHGSVVVNGKLRFSPGRDCAIVFQGDSLFPWSSVLRNAAFGLISQGVPKEQALSTAREWLVRVGLPEHVAGQKPGQLSGGMRQRVNLVRALALEPPILLMDEPFASLDYQTREELQLELLRVVENSTTAIMFITHDVTEAVFLGERIVVIDAQQQGISRTFDVPWPRSSRQLEIKTSPEFTELCSEVSSAVRGPDVA